MLSDELAPKGDDFYLDEMVKALAGHAATDRQGWLTAARKMEPSERNRFEDPIVVIAREYNSDLAMMASDVGVRVGDTPKQLKRAELALEEAARALDAFNQTTLSAVHGDGYRPKINPDTLRRAQKLGALHALVSGYRFPYGPLSSGPELDEAMRGGFGPDLRAAADVLSWGGALRALSIFYRERRLGFEEHFRAHYDRELAVLHRGPSGRLPPSKRALAEKRAAAEREASKQGGRQKRAALEGLPVRARRNAPVDRGGTEHAHELAWGSPRRKMLLSCACLIQEHLGRDAVTTSPDGILNKFSHSLHMFATDTEERSNFAHPVREISKLARLIAKQVSGELRPTQEDPHLFERHASLGMARKYAIYPDWAP